MKRGTPEHPKMKSLARMLNIPLPQAVGMLEMLWHATAKFAIQGNIGKWGDEEIAGYVHWEGDPADLIDALVKNGWLDRDPDFRLIIHDWDAHADQSVRKTLKSKGMDFIKPGRVHYVYFLRSTTTGQIKIGTSCRLEQRIADITRASREPLEVIGSVEGSFALEDALHKKYAEHRVIGEWFEPTEELEKEIKTMLRGTKNRVSKVGSLPEAFRNDSRKVKPAEAEAEAESLSHGLSRSRSHTPAPEVQPPPPDEPDPPPDSDSGERALTRVSDSDSRAGPRLGRTRKHAYTGWRAAVSRLFAPRGSPQHHADDTSSRRLFDDDLWPEDIDADVGFKRVKRALELVPEAQTRKVPMAWLTKRIRDEVSNRSPARAS